MQREREREREREVFKTFLHPAAPNVCNNKQRIVVDVLTSMEDGNMHAQL